MGVISVIGSPVFPTVQAGREATSYLSGPEDQIFPPDQLNFVPDQELET